MRALQVVGICTLTLASALHGAYANELTLAQALKAAADNLDVALARSNVAAARADVLSANRSPFPSLTTKLSSIDLEKGTGSGNVLSEQRIDKSIGLDWTLERGNKRELRTTAAQRTANAAQADFEEIQIQQLLAASAAYFDLALAQERAEKINLIAASTAQISTIANRRVAAGDLARQDALRLEIESERAQTDVLNATLDLRKSSFALTTIMGSGDAGQTLKVKAQWPAVQMDSALATSPQSFSLENGIEARADVMAANQRVAAAQATLDSASAQKKADVTVGASLDHFPGTSTALLELRLQMPLQYGYEFQGEIARARAQLTAAQNALDKTRRLAAFEMETLYAQLTSAATRRKTYDERLLPQATLVANQAELAFTKGALPLGDLLDARRTLKLTELEALAARADHAKASTAWQLRTQPAANLLNE